MTSPAPDVRQVTAAVVRLKLRLLANTWRAEAWQLVSAILGYLAAAGTAVALVAVAVGLRFAEPEVAALVVTGLGTVAGLLWTVTPLLTFGLDATVDPARFAPLPVRAGTLLPGVLVAGVLGPPGVATLLAALATTVTWARGPEVVLAPVAALVGTATCVALARVVTTAAAGLLSARRGREASAAVFALVMAMIGLIPVAGEALGRRIGDSGWDPDALAGLLGWTPFGAAWAVPGAVSTGHPGRAAAQAALAVAVLGGLLWWWRRLLARSLEAPPSATASRRTAGPRTLFDRFPASPTGAVAARVLLAFRRDSRYLIVLVSPAVLMLVLSVTTRGLSSGPALGLVLGAFTIGLTAANVYGYDGTAFAAHLLLGVPGRADLRGRVAALLAVAVPVVLAGAVVAASVSGSARRFPLIASVGLGVLLITVGMGVVSSVLAPYPMPEAGSNPFASRSSGGLRPFLSQLALMSVLGICAGPPLLLGLLVDAWWAQLTACLVTPAAGLAILVGGLVWAARLYDRRGPEILLAVRRPG
ncbi:MAG: hypothetical protein U0Q15_02475 [Kineosporiaceae bacterium]